MPYTLYDSLKAALNAGYMVEASMDWGYLLKQRTGTGWKFAQVVL
jgi:hypothetical protein